VTAFRHGYAGSRKPPGITGSGRACKTRAPDSVMADQGLFDLVVAGVGFEPT
jgi:hypothetical protein